MAWPGAQHGELSADDIDAIVTEAGRFATDVIAPLNAPGDKFGTPFKDGRITMPPGWKEAYRAWAAAGWNAVSAPADWGGQALPNALNAACIEMWNSASMAFGIGPVLTMGAVEAFARHGSETLKQQYLAKLVSGEWMGTMQLTEPQAGSDVGALRTKAERAADGSYRIVGTKIFITYGDHDLTDNIIHFVLARLPDAPAGNKGISLFLVPKFLLNADGSPGPRNDVRAHSIEHKLGIHASPTCTMVYGDNGGAVGYLIGEEHKGMACMFTMMNRARLAVGLQGVGIAERATQQALEYARERKQGREPGIDGSSPIIAHPDVKRMLLTMRAMTRAARAICYATAGAIDRGEEERAALLTPIAKAFSTDAGIEVASLGVQVHGGMGFIEETGAAQHYRDARIAAIYEGTNGIQALDLVSRKMPMSGGQAVAGYLAELRRTVDAVYATNDPAFGWTGVRLAEAVDSVERATQWLLGKLDKEPQAAQAGATPYLRLFGNVAGGCMLADEALAALRLADGEPAARIALARFFAENVAVQARGLERAVTEGADSVNNADAALAQLSWGGLSEARSRPGRARTDDGFRWRSAHPTFDPMSRTLLISHPACLATSDTGRPSRAARPAARRRAGARSGKVPAARTASGRRWQRARDHRACAIRWITSSSCTRGLAEEGMVRLDADILDVARHVRGGAARHRRRHPRRRRGASRRRRQRLRRHAPRPATTPRPRGRWALPCSTTPPSPRACAQKQPRHRPRRDRRFRRASRQWLAGDFLGRQIGDVLLDPPDAAVSRHRRRHQVIRRCTIRSSMRRCAPATAPSQFRAAVRRQHPAAAARVPAGARHHLGRLRRPHARSAPASLNLAEDDFVWVTQNHGGRRSVRWGPRRLAARGRL